MSGSLILQIGMFVAVAAALLQFIADKSGNATRKHKLLVIAMIATALSAFIGFWGNDKKQDEDKDELKAFNEQRDSIRAKADIRMDRATADFNHRTDSAARANKYERDSLSIAHEIKIGLIHDLAEYKIDNLHANYAGDMKEAFGILSRRTLENYLMEKTPEELSLVETKTIINKTLVHYILNDLYIPYFEDSAEIEYKDSTYTIGTSIDIKTNVSIVASFTRTFWDLHIKNSAGPDDHTYVSVIINTGEKSEHSFLYDGLSNKIKELYYKYGKWYESIRSNPSSHWTFHHLVISVVDKKDESLGSDGPAIFMDECNLWIGNYLHSPKLDDNERKIIIYERNEVEKEHKFLK